MNERFQDWQYPEIEEGKLTKYNWLGQHVHIFKLGSTCSRHCNLSSLGPCIMAETNTTTMPTYTLRPKKRTEGGVLRLRHPSREQQKL